MIFHFLEFLWQFEFIVSGPSSYRILSWWYIRCDGSTSTIFLYGLPPTAMVQCLMEACIREFQNLFIKLFTFGLDKIGRCLLLSIFFFCLSEFKLFRLVDARAIVRVTQCVYTEWMVYLLFQLAFKWSWNLARSYVVLDNWDYAHYEWAVHFLLRP